MLPYLLAGAALGALRGRQQEKAAHEDRKVQGTKNMWATFTGVHGKDTPQADMMGAIMQGAMAGAMLGQSMANGGEVNNYAQEDPQLLGNVPQTGARSPAVGGAPRATPGQMTMPGYQVPNMYA